MDRSEIIELRKLFKTYKESGCPTGGFSGGFIDTEGKIKGSFGEKNFHDTEDAVKRRIFTFASKTISNNAVTLPIDADMKNLFDKINATKGANKELCEELCSRISPKADGKTYAISVLGYTYDPPAKTSDHKTIIDGVSDEIYHFFVCMISPVSTTKPSFGYFTDKEKFGMNPLLKIVEDPVAGFVYPDFTGRTSDPDGVLCFRTEKFDIGEKLFGDSTLPIAEKPKKTKNSEISGEVKSNKAADEYAQTALASSSFRAATTHPKLDIPSLNSGNLSMEEVRGRDITAEKAVTKESDTETAQLINPSVKKEKKIRISGDTKTLKQKLVDGVMCFVIPVSEADTEF